MAAKTDQISSVTICARHKFGLFTQVRKVEASIRCVWLMQLTIRLSLQIQYGCQNCWKPLKIALRYLGWVYTYSLQWTQHNSVQITFIFTWSQICEFFTNTYLLTAILDFYVKIVVRSHKKYFQNIPDPFKHRYRAYIYVSATILYRVIMDIWLISEDGGGHIGFNFFPMDKICAHPH